MLPGRSRSFKLGDKERNPFKAAQAWRGSLGADLPQARFRFRFRLGPGDHRRRHHRGQSAGLLPQR